MMAIRIIASPHKEMHIRQADRVILEHYRFDEVLFLQLYWYEYSKKVSEK